MPVLVMVLVVQKIKKTDVTKSRLADKKDQRSRITPIGKISQIKSFNS